MYLFYYRTIIIYIGIWILWVILRANNQFFKNKKPNSLLLFCGIFFFLGLSLYLYLPFIHPNELDSSHSDSLTNIVNDIKSYFNITSSTTPAYSWGNTATFSGWIHHVLRKDYGTLQLFPERETVHLTTFDFLLSNLKVFLQQPEYNINIYGLFILGLLKQVKMIRKRGILEIGTILLISLFVYLFGFFALCNIPVNQNPILKGIFERFFQQANIIVFVFVTQGLSVIELIILSIISFFSHKRIDRIIIQISLLVILVSIVWIHLQASHPEYMQFPNNSPNCSKNVYHYWTEDVLTSLPKNSILLLYGDLETNIIHYYQHRWNIRPDITLLSIIHLSYPWWETGNYKSKYNDIHFPGSVLATGCSPNLDEGGKIFIF